MFRELCVQIRCFVVINQCPWHGRTLLDTDLSARINLLSVELNVSLISQRHLPLTAFDFSASVFLSLVTPSSHWRQQRFIFSGRKLGPPGLVSLCEFHAFD